MFGIKLFDVFVGLAVIVFAAISAWIELRVEQREGLPHRKVLRSTPQFREYMARRNGRVGRSIRSRRRRRQDRR